ncbi:MAG: DedA family protein [Bacteroidales bacterium]
MNFASFIQWCIENLNYGIIIILMAIESTVIPLPSELIVPPAGYKSASGELNIFFVIMAATIGNNIGAIIMYYLSKWIGRPLVIRFVNCRVGKLLLLNENKFHHAEKFFNKHGNSAIFFGRLIPGIRHLISIPAGLSQMSLSRLIIYTTLGSSIWNTILAFTGYSFYKVVPEDLLLSKITYYNSIITMTIWGIILLIVIFIIFKYYRKSKISHKSN